MSFKLLAIRPLEYCDPSILRNLNPNCIYQFYNEYDYNYKIEDTTHSFISLQDKTLFHDSDGITSIPNHEITSITANLKVLDYLYGANVNISAVVGKNGSGKSSLLELIYSFVFNISKKYKILKFPKEKIAYNEVNVEFYYIDEKNYYKITHKYINTNTINIVIQKSIDGEDFTELNNYNKILFKFYYLVINYSMYGLNSNISGAWIEKLFHKNDGYQSPIVINPFRKKGNFDVNNEYNLSQARLILHKYFINNSDLIKGITLEGINFLIDVEKVQYREETENKKRLIFEDLINFIESNNFAGRQQFSEVINLIFNIDGLAEPIYLKELKDFFINHGYKKRFKIKSLTNDFKIQLMYLCFLYIFKKVTRISTNYEEYNRYKFLFRADQFNELFKDDINDFKAILKKKIKLGDLSNSIHNSQDQSILHAQTKLYLYAQESIINQYGGIISGDAKFVAEKVIKSDTKSRTVEEQVNLIFEEFNNIINSHRKYILKQYLEDLHNNDTHIAFKFRQTINYFTNDLFSKMSMMPMKGNESYKISKYNVVISKDYFEDVEIYNVPISFFEPEIIVKKDNKEYSFHKLSSGEQQLIHSILNITYHLYNLDSVGFNTKGKKVYKNINIVFDEVELYFHPDFQRNFISNLIDSISYFKNLNFNIVFSTHSPFILSDIPSQNILRLREGKPVIEKTQLNSFGANIHDLLADEFFLNENTMGAFASDKIDEIIKFLNLKNNIIQLTKDSGNDIFSMSLRKSMIKESVHLQKKLESLSQLDQEKVQAIVNIIGEPVIKSKMQEMVNIVFNNL